MANPSYLTYPKLTDYHTPLGFSPRCDSSFRVDTKSTWGKMVRSCKTNETATIRTSWGHHAVDLIMQVFYPNGLQFIEWGVRALKGPFGRLILPLSADCSKCCRKLTVFPHLLNPCTTQVRWNQMLTTYAVLRYRQQPMEAALRRRTRFSPAVMLPKMERGRRGGPGKTPARRCELDRPRCAAVFSFSSQRSLPKEQRLGSKQRNKSKGTRFDTTLFAHFFTDP